ncbi:uncharacterized protein LY89DRAFT_764630 [Mollisia scopiformis]|uniref:Acyltransferase 3 domain-containing protein n=1 Tax=Mollisia scopiformis TaxID=149040 RepID=A0A132B9E6_MOLSC|nr:uncharacterized protein LY89DRAFT_764630 [Mollisia scopiformis]KUJ08494.1 hypothetical protein LY89DRAFT_764630 [Mollisia scopiformis]
MMAAQDSECRSKTETQEGDALIEEFYFDNESTLPGTSPRDSRNVREEDDDLSSVDLPALLGQFSIIFCTIFWITIDAIIPSFIPRFGFLAVGNAASDKRGRDSPTEFMDGLRGIATVIVYANHFIVNWFPVLKHQYGQSPSDIFTLQLPIFRVFLSGGAAVAVFFVISGYVLSYSGLKKISLDQRSEAFDSLASSVFRRCIRIYLPCAANTLLCALLAYNDLFVHDPPGFNVFPTRFPTLSLQLGDWWLHLKELVYPFRSVEEAIYSPPYNGHLWTIPLEIRGSWVTYGTVLASANLIPAWRMLFLCGLNIYVSSYAKWDLFLFISGIIIANMDVQRHIAARQEDASLHIHGQPGAVFLPTEEPPMIEMQHLDQGSKWSSWSRVSGVGTQRPLAVLLNILTSLRQIIYVLWPYILFVAAMYTLSGLKDPWGIDGLIISWFGTSQSSTDYMSPGGGRRNPWMMIGAALLVYSLSLSTKACHIPTFESRPTLFERLKSSCRSFRLQWLFTNCVSRYLGRISFGVYLMHGPVLFTMGTRFLVPAWAEWDAGGPDIEDRYMSWFYWAMVWNTIGVIWAGDVFTRVIDEPSARFAGKVAKFMSRNNKVTAS